MNYLMNSREMATERWRTHTSAAGLTWGMMLDGAPLVAALARHVRLEGASIFEIGPGYGRLLRALLHSPMCLSPSLGTYVGLDISAHWTRELAAEFSHEKSIEFLQGAAEDADTLLAGRQFDLIVSLLTWKHLYPDFSSVARSCRNLLAADGRLIVDVPETGVAWPAEPDEPAGKFEQETGTFTRTYSRAEIAALLRSANFSIAAFDEIEHAPDKRRLLVVSSRGFRVQGSGFSDAQAKP
jgi:SAM-dependent methyltransferase